jgi:hypothetical protein
MLRSNADQPNHQISEAAQISTSATEVTCCSSDSVFQRRQMEVVVCDGNRFAFAIYRVAVRVKARINFCELQDSVTNCWVIFVGVGRSVLSDHVENIDQSSLKLWLSRLASEIQSTECLRMIFSSPFCPLWLHSTSDFFLALNRRWWLCRFPI